MKNQERYYAVLSAVIIVGYRDEATLIGTFRQLIIYLVFSLRNLVEHFIVLAVPCGFSCISFSRQRIAIL